MLVWNELRDGKSTAANQTGANWAVAWRSTGDGRVARKPKRVSPLM